MERQEFIETFADLLANWPLYKRFTFVLSEVNSRTQSSLLVPRTIRQFCFQADCDAVTIWEADVAIAGHYQGHSGLSYKCRHCKTSVVSYHWYWRSSTQTQAKTLPGLIYKWGQIPQLLELVPKELSRRLDKADLLLYRNSLRCRNQNMGLAAASYLRRVVENKINLILDEISAEAAKYGFEEDQLSKLEQVKHDWRFSEKIKFAGIILPQSLRPGGHNPIDQLHDLASEGVHYWSDEEALDIYDRCRPVFEYLFREIDARKKSAADYAESLAKLAGERKKRDKT